MALSTKPNPSAKRMPEPGLFSTPGTTNIVSSDRHITSGNIVKSLHDVHRFEEAMRSPPTSPTSPGSPTSPSGRNRARGGQGPGGLSVATDDGGDERARGSGLTAKASWKPASPSRRSEEADRELYAREEWGTHYDHGMTEVG